MNSDTKEPNMTAKQCFEKHPQLRTLVENIVAETKNNNDSAKTGLRNLAKHLQGIYGLSRHRALVVAEELWIA